MDIRSNVSNAGTYIETVRSLHQTVTALRTALEASKKEILDLKNKVWPVESIEQSLTALAIENHALRRKLIDNSGSELSKTIELHLNEIKNDENTTLRRVPELVETDEKLLDSNPNPDVTPHDIKNNTESIEPLESFKFVVSEQSELDRTNGNTVNKTGVEESGKLVSADADKKSGEATIANVCDENQEKHLQSANVDGLKQPKIGKYIFSETADLKTDIKEQSSPHILTSVDVDESTPIDKITNENLNKGKEVHFVENSPTKESKKAKKEKRSTKKHIKSVHKSRIRASVHIKTRTSDGKKKSKSLDSLTIVKTPFRELKLSKTSNFFNLNSEVSCEIINMSENNPNINNEYETEDEKQSDDIEEKCENEMDQEPEVDDIELIFTTDDTKESDFKEQLVSIDSLERQSNTGNLKLLAPDQEQSVDISDRELDDDVFDTSFDQDNKDCNALQVFQLQRDNSQLYNSKSDNSINEEERSLRSYYSYQDSSFENKSMEKDESFDRFEERIRIVETDISKVGITEVDYAGIRRNTCPNPLQYRPLLHREAINKGLNIKKSRPILAHSSAVRRESGAQTDISALPGSAWRSESSLANKAHLGDNFTTLPSKFPLPGSRLKLSEKTTVEARRVLLSDIGFTSMVPELSRSADHLCPALKPPVTTYGQFLRTPELYSPAYTSQRFTWTATTATPSDGSHSHSRYSINPLTPPVQTRRCSAPVSPSRRGTLKSTTSRVRFANGSLPELRGDWTQMTADSGDSTDSLVEEAENYLRRSIDCILGKSKEGDRDTKRYILRRASAPESAGDNTPPQGWQPFLPRQPRDLKPDHWVKVITPEGKVKGGRVRYIGPVVSQTDQFVGVQLGVPEGHSDGTYNTRRYFQCEPCHGIFVPFKKVIMGWRP